VKEWQSEGVTDGRQVQIYKLFFLGKRAKNQYWNFWKLLNCHIFQFFELNNIKKIYKTSKFFDTIPFQLWCSQKEHFSNNFLPVRFSSLFLCSSFTVHERDTNFLLISVEFNFQRVLQQKKSARIYIWIMFTASYTFLWGWKREMFAGFFCWNQKFLTSFHSAQRGFINLKSVWKRSA
jgi:hypothetical protein